MNKPASDDKQEKFFQKFMENFPIGGDITLMILKGHLLVEEEINETLDYFVNNSEYLEKANLTFSQKIDLLRALLPSEIHEIFYAAEMLNRLRNKIAHNLKPKGLEDSIKNFLKSIDDSYNKTMSSKETIEHLIYCIGRLQAGLAGNKDALCNLKLSHIKEENSV